MGGKQCWTRRFQKKDESEPNRRVRRLQLIEKFKGQYEALVAEVLRRAEELNTLEAKLSVAMRRELGFAIDEARFLESAEKAGKEHRRVVEEWFKRSMQGI